MIGYRIKNDGPAPAPLEPGCLYEYIPCVGRSMIALCIGPGALHGLGMAEAYTGVIRTDWRKLGADDVVEPEGTE